MNKEQGPPPVDALEDLLNTDDRYRGVDHLRRAGIAERMAVRLGLEPMTVDPEELIRLRDALRSLVDGPADAALAELAAANPLRISFDDDTVRLVGATPTGHVLALVERAAASGAWARLSVCRNPACRWVYYDGSKNRSGRWCSTECSHVMRSRAYRARHAAGG
jgi:predicted RNA-binding Zn ribbon-like protein